MKVCHTSEIFTFQKTLILQLQLTLELSQFQEIFSTYTDFLFLFAEYLYLFKIFKNEINSLQGKNALFKNNFITQAPARDGGNWYTYSIEYYKNNAGGNTAMVKYDGEWWYTYDKNGNRTAKGKVKLTNGSSYIPYSDNNPGCREGNVVIDKSYEYWEYTWDLNNRLTKVEQKKDEYDDELVCVEYTYDALNFRISRKSTLEGTLTRYAYGRNGALSYEEFSKDDAVVGSRSYAYFNNQVIGFTDTQGTTEQKRYAVTDILGTVTQIYSENNELLWDNSYTAFGIPDVATTDKFEDIFEFYGMFTGCQYDNETGLTYHWNRWRSESGNYFISVDAQRDGDNWYVYCGQNPLTRYDKSGLNWMDREGNWHSNSETGINYNITYTIPNIQTPEEKIPNPNAYLTNSNLSGKEKNKIPGMSDSDYKEFEEKKALALLYNEKNQLLAKILIKYLNVKYKSGGFSAEGIDCSGLLGRALADMGYNITRDDVQSGKLAKGKVDWLGIFPVSDNKRTGILGMINFYKVSGSKVINHMNYGIGTNNTPIPLLSPMDQIIDATEKDSMLIRNDGRPGQYFEAGAGQVNQTYAPFSSNTDVSIQGYVRWEVLEANYRN